MWRLPVLHSLGAEHSARILQCLAHDRGPTMSRLLASPLAHNGGQPRGGIMDWRSRIVADTNVLVGKPVIKGTRISVELVMDLLAGGYTPDQIRDQYDHLTLDDIHACLAYAREVISSERMFAVKG